MRIGPRAAGRPGSRRGGGAADAAWRVGRSRVGRSRVGRSRALAGPYLDRAGTALLNGGGTPLLEGDADWAGPGHNAVLFDGLRAFNVYHAYATTNGASQLRISELAWDEEGWPVSGGP